MFASSFWRSMLAMMFLIFIVAEPAQATRLEVDSDTNVILKFGAAIILYAHILGGFIGLIAGVVASLSKKGSTMHRGVGRVFFAAMLVCYVIGALVAPFLSDGQRPNFVAAVLALYLLISGVDAARKRPYTVGYRNVIGLFVSLGIAVMGATFVYMGYQSDTGTVDGSPPQAFILFILAGMLALAGEVRVIIKKSLPNADRIARHLWRMCFSFFIASGSLFFGQAQFFPEWFNTSILPGLLSFFPIFILIFWWIKIKWKGIRAIKSIRGPYSTPT